MKLSISNIGWGTEQDETVYALMKKFGYTGLEIAPTRIFPEKPYELLSQAATWGDELKKRYGLCISSMQSIWFGRQEKLFGTDEERRQLIDYTKKAVDFAVAVGCKNLVFGCPRNRVVPEGMDAGKGIVFFQETGSYALQNGVVIGMEANPPIYHTNYVNNTQEALDLIRQVNSKGFRLNLDVGTMIQNQENIEELADHIHLINHVHISEPGLRAIEPRKIHRDLREVLSSGFYQGFVSIEMGKVDDLSVLEDKMEYVRSVFQ